MARLICKATTEGVLAALRGVGGTALRSSIHEAKQQAFLLGRGAILRV